MPTAAALSTASRWYTDHAVPPPVGAARLDFGLRICRLHRVIYVEDDRFPIPCAQWGGHEPQNPA